MKLRRCQKTNRQQHFSKPTTKQPTTATNTKQTTTKNDEAPMKLGCCKNTTNRQPTNGGHFLMFAHEGQFSAVFNEERIATPGMIQLFRSIVRAGHSMGL